MPAGSPGVVIFIPSRDPVMMEDTPLARDITSLVLVVRLNEVFQRNRSCWTGDALSVNSKPLLAVSPTCCRMLLLVELGTPTDGGSGTAKINPSIALL